MSRGGEDKCRAWSWSQHGKWSGLPGCCGWYRNLCLGRLETNCLGQCYHCMGWNESLYGWSQKGERSSLSFQDVVELYFLLRWSQGWPGDLSQPLNSEQKWLRLHCWGQVLQTSAPSAFFVLLSPFSLAQWPSIFKILTASLAWNSEQQEWVWTLPTHSEYGQEVDLYVLGCWDLKVICYCHRTWPCWLISMEVTGGKLTWL